VTSTTHRIEFGGSQGVALAARLDLPAGDVKALALFAHCFTCSKESFAAARISTGLVDHGFGVLRFDFTGLGSSDGDFANTNFSSNTEDLVCAAGWLIDNHGPARVLIGHSLGGAAALAVASRLETVEGVVTIGAPSDVTHVEALLGDAVETIETAGEAPVELAGRSFLIRRQFLDDLRATELLDRVATMHRPLLVMHSPMDAQVDISHAARIYQAARHPKSFMALDGADHMLSRPADALYASRIIAAWADRHTA
jgi:alpha/beta superfamily hydrolase